MKTLVRNIGVLVSGDIRRPWLDADSLVLRDDVIGLTRTPIPRWRSWRQRSTGRPEVPS
jgi:hypothetical protein